MRLLGDMDNQLRPHGTKSKPTALDPPEEGENTKVSSTGPGNTTKTRTSCTNWFHPAQFGTINRIAKLNNFKNGQRIVNELQCGVSGESFKSLHRGTIVKWINRDGSGWTADTLEKVKWAAEQDVPDVPHIIAPGTVMGRPRTLVRVNIIYQSHSFPLRLLTLCHIF